MAGNHQNKERIKRLIVAGKSNEEIANELNIAVKTVKYHLTSILKAEKVKSRLALGVKYAAMYTNEEHKSNVETLQNIISQQDERIVELTKLIMSIKHSNFLPGVKL